jgi:hypothetical protein
MNTHTEQSKWTPGPWRIGDAGTTIFGPPNGTPFPKMIASITNNPFPSKSQRANARLIAAAPQLYQALLALTQIARTFRNVPKEEQDWGPIDDEVLDNAFEVLAHAEGREM